jgi:ElaB/YqjD/DUF883 family membrane-anchored ribosome-binding protein
MGSSLHNLNEIEKETCQQINNRTDDIVSKLNAKREELQQELESSVSVSKSNLEKNKSKMEKQLENSKSLSKWADDIVMCKPSSGVDIAKADSRLDELKRFSEIRISFPIPSTPLFIPSNFKLPDNNPIGSLHTSTMR